MQAFLYMSSMFPQGKLAAASEMITLVLNAKVTSDSGI